MLQYLLPGFISAAIFYGLTPHPKPAPFERIISALMFTFFVTVIGDAASWFPLLSESAKTPGVSLIIAILAGGIAAGCANYDIPHRWLRRLHFTNQISKPDNWSFVFSSPPMKNTYIVLNLKDGRSIYGWAELWPDSSREGHFLLTNYRWFNENGDLDEKRSSSMTILIDAESVDMVEFASQQGEQ